MRPPKRAKMVTNVILEVENHLEHKTSSNAATVHAEPIGIFRLNDDCFDSIFRKLHTDDLEAFAATCKHIHNLAKVYFARLYSNKRLEVSNVGKSIAVRKHKIFSDVIKNVCFRCAFRHRKDAYDVLSYYMHLNCNKQPKYLRFENMVLQAKEGKLIEQVLKHAEVVELIRCDSDNVYQYILRRCIALKSLTVRLGMVEKSHTNSWLSHQFPLLEIADIFLNGWSNHEEVVTFFKLNPQIKKFTCRSRLNRECMKIENVMDAVTYNAPQLEDLSLTIGGDCDFRRVYAQLLVVSTRSVFKRLSLEFSNTDVKDVFIDNFNNLACIDKLHVLHITNVDFVKDLPNNSNELKNLSELHLCNLANCDHSAIILSSIVPNLQKLVVRDSCYFTPSVIDFLQPFIAYLPKLNKIFLNHDVWARINQNMVYLNEKRQQLDGACIVSIWARPPKTKLKEPTIDGKVLIKMMKLTYESEQF